MPGPVSDSYDPEFGTVANAADVREAISSVIERANVVLGPRLMNIVVAAQGEAGQPLAETLTEREWRLIRFGLRRALESI